MRSAFGFVWEVLTLQFLLAACWLFERGGERQEFCKRCLSCFLRAALLRVRVNVSSGSEKACIRVTKIAEKDTTGTESQTPLDSSCYVRSKRICSFLSRILSTCVRICTRTFMRVFCYREPQNRNDTHKFVLVHYVFV